MLELVLSEARATAGSVVHGRVRTSDEPTPVAVDLVRIERSPAGFATYRVVRAELADDGTFTLVVPDEAPPDVSGRECSLLYAVRAVAGAEEARAAFSVGL